MEGGIGLILDLTPKEEKRIEGLKRLALASHISTEKIVLRPTLIRKWRLNNSLFAIILVKREKFHWLPLASKGTPSIGELPLLGKEGFMGILQ